MARNHTVRHVVARLLDGPWLLTEQKLEQICGILELRASGVDLTRDEIVAKIGEPKGGTLRVTTTPSGVRIIPVMGVVAHRANMFTEASGGTSTEQLTEAVQAAVADSTVRAIVLQLDTPGGSVMGTAELSQAIFNGRGTKPIVAVADGEMCSAGYYIGSAADHVVASPSSQIGSIGAVMLHRDESKANEQAGYKYTVIASGDHKADLNPYGPLTEQGLATARERVRAHYTNFVEAVARNRGLTFSQVEERYGRGKVFVGQQAVTQGLADRIGTLGEVVAELEKKVTGGRGVSASANQGIVFEELTVNELIVKALVGMGLLQEGASEDTGKAVLQGWYHAQGKKPPTEELQVLKDLMAPPTKPAATPAATDPPQPPAPQAAESERQRIRAIQSTAKSLGIVATEFVEGLVDSGVSLNDAKVQMVEHLANLNPPIKRKDLDTATFEDKHTEFRDAATDAILLAMGRVKTKPAETAASRSLRYCSVASIARQSLELAGFRVDALDPVTLSKVALGWGTPNAMEFLGYSSGGSWNTPAAFPNLLSNLQNKFLDGAMELAGYTWRDWVVIKPSLKDFKPATLLKMGVFPELSGRNQDGKFPRATTGEEYNWYKAEEYGQEWDLTPVMIANDDLGTFGDTTISQIDAADATRNRLCVERLTSNPTLPDGVSLFHADRSNLIASGGGGVPSRGEAAKVREKMRNQMSVGPVDNRRRLNLTLVGGNVLVPTTLEDEAEQTFAVGLMPEVTPTADTSRNLFRGKVGVLVDAMLDDYSTVKWYSFSQKGKRPTIVLAFQQGYERDKIESWYDPSTGSRVFKIQSNFAVGNGDFRGVVCNDGN